MPVSGFVPVIAWIEEAALIILLGVIVLLGAGTLFWPIGSNRQVVTTSVGEIARHYRWPQSGWLHAVMLDHRGRIAGGEGIDQRLRRLRLFCVGVKASRINRDPLNIRRQRADIVHTRRAD